MNRVVVSYWGVWVIRGHNTGTYFTAQENIFYLLICNCNFRSHQYWDSWIKISCSGITSHVEEGLLWNTWDFFSFVLFFSTSFHYRSITFVQKYAVLWNSHNIYPELIYWCSQELESYSQICIEGDDACNSSSVLKFVESCKMLNAYEVLEVVDTQTKEDCWACVCCFLPSRASD